MAVHARLGRRHIREGGVFHLRMAVLAVDPQLAGVQPMAVGDGLFRSIANVGVLRAEVVPHEENGDYTAPRYGKQAEGRKQIGASRKYLWHRSGRWP